MKIMPLYKVMCCHYETVDASNEKEAIDMLITNETADFYWEAKEITDDDLPEAEMILGF